MQITLQIYAFKFVQMVLTQIIQLINVFRNVQMFHLILDISKNACNLVPKTGLQILHQDYVFNPLIVLEILMEILQAKDV